MNVWRVFVPEHWLIEDEDAFTEKKENTVTIKFWIQTASFPAAVSRANLLRFQDSLE